MGLAEVQQGEPKKTYLFAYPLHRTYAPFLHNTSYYLNGVPWNYSKLEIQDGMDTFLELTKKDDFGGSAVSMPYKVAITAKCDALTPEGAAIGACNTVFWRTNAEGKRELVGHNTDCIGVSESFLHGAGPILTKDKARPGMIIGGGGASRASVYALNVSLNCNPIYIVNRDDDEVKTLMADFKKHATKDFNPELIHLREPEDALKWETPAYIVGAVPSFPPVTEGEIRARAVIEAVFSKPEKGVILEMCYHPHIWTTVCQLAKDAGWTVVTGEVAMIHQGIEQQKIWFGCEKSELKVQETFDIVRAQVAADTAAGAKTVPETYTPPAQV